jgi:uncharacterized membrane protein YoaK (UPF0700 family)
VAGGFVDAVGYMVLDHLFTAHMSGNSAAMGAHLGQGDWGEVLYRAWPIPLFVIGVAAGAALVELAGRRGIRSSGAPLLLLEMGLLAAFMAQGSRLPAHGWERYPLVALPVLAMGLQTATLQRVAGRTVRTTYVSGMLTQLAQEAVTYLFLRHDHEPAQAARGRALLLLAIWSCYAAGAVAGGFGEGRWRLHALALPIGLLVLVAVLDLRRPHRTGRQVSR